MLDQTIKVNTAVARPIVNVAFPNYRGRKFKVVLTDKVGLYDLNWSGGTKRDYVRLSLDSGVGHLPTPNPYHNQVEGTDVALDERTIWVCHHNFCGHDMGIEIYLSPALAAAYGIIHAQLTDGN